MPVLLQEGRLLHARRACSQIQKGPFFCLNTHALHSCGAKQIYIKIKYSSPSHAFHSPTRFLSTPTPLPFRPQPTYLPFPAHSPSAPIPLPFCPQPALPSPLLPELVHLLPCLLSPPTCSLVHSSTRQLTMLLTELVHLLPCLFSHTTCSLVSPSTRQLIMLLPELVHLLPCLLSHTTCSLVSPSTRQLTMLLLELVHLLPCLLSHTTCSPSPRQPVNLQCYSSNLFTCYHVY